MFDIGWDEMLLTAIVAIIVIGPKDLPMALRTAGRWVGKVRRVSGYFRSGIETMIRDAELEEMERRWKEQNAAIMSAHPPAASAEAALAAGEAPLASGAAPMASGAAPLVGEDPGTGTGSALTDFAPMPEAQAPASRSARPRRAGTKASPAKPRQARAKPAQGR